MAVKNGQSKKKGLATGSSRVLLAGGALGAVGYGAWRAGRTRFSPKVAGTLKIEGLQQPVEVIRDEWGVPHLYATTLEDLFLAQGFVQAQDRFWQMEFQRRLAAGRLAEVLGEAALPADRLLRRLELNREAQKSYLYILEHENPMPLERFTAGVNAFIALKKLPLEISLLRYQPLPWTPTDSLGWANVMTLGQSNNFFTELARAEIVRAAGPELAARLEPWPSVEHPLIVPPEARYAGVDFEPILAEYIRLAEWLGLLRVGTGSNNWVVDGTKTDSGLPLLANDPHISAQLPGTFYAMHLSGPDFEVMGACVPGLPGVILGHNSQIAWGVTNTMGDIQDAFIEQLDPANPRRYRYRDEWHEFETHFEEIRVKGQAVPVRQEQFRSLHGPIISEFSASGSVALDGGTVQGAPVALAWTLYDHPYSLDGLMALNRAANWSEFRTALKAWPYPSFNFVYADTAGHIGYQYAGLIPRRRAGLGLLPSPGHTGEYDWAGFVPFEELPSVFDPPAHFLATANNKVTDDDYPHHLGSDYANGVRAERIRQLLTEREKFGVADFQAIMGDLLCPTGLRLARYLTRLEGLTDGHEQRAQASIATWDGRLGADSVPGCIYEVTMGKLLRRVLEPQLGQAALNHYLGVADGFAPLTALYSLAGPHLLNFLERADTSILPPALPTWDEALRTAFKEAVAWLRQTLGEDLRGWEWGKLHTMAFNHVLGQKPPLDRVFNRGPLGVGGDSDTVFQTAYAFKEDHYEANGGTPAWRMIADLSNWDNSVMSVQGGQSGSPFSPHYADAIEPWLIAQNHPMLFSRTALAQHTAGILKLV